MKRHNPTGRDDSADRFIKKLRRRWYIVSAVIITLWAAWTLLDAFVIPRDILAIEEIAEAVSPEGESVDGEAADAPIDDEPLSKQRSKTSRPTNRLKRRSKFLM